MRRILYSSLISTSLLMIPHTLWSVTVGEDEVKKPNVLFLFVDDMTYNGLNILGNEEIISPNLDKLISGGVRFSNAYIMGGWSGAISIASRSQLITGRYLWNTHQAEKVSYESELANQEMWPQVMKNAGYKTFFTGKWHMKHIAASQLFDKVAKVRGGMPKDTEDVYNRPVNKNDIGWTPWDKSKGGYWSEGKHWSEVLADETITYMEQNKDSEQPLFMFCAFNAPHDPRQAPKEFVDLYNMDSISIPDNFIPIHPLCEEMKSGRTLRDERLAPFPRTSYAIQKHRQEYYALITHLDYQIGRIMNALRKNGMEQNTLIVFAADNGLSVGHHGLMGKQSMYDHSMKVPLVFCGLGLPKGEIRYQLAYLQDLVPTVYDLIGVKKPLHLDFISQMEVLMDCKFNSKHDTIYGAYLQDAQRMITDGHYKLFFIPSAQKAYLFDLDRDPLETENLFKNPEYSQVLQELAKKYLKVSESSGDTYDLTAIYPELFY